MIESLLNAIAPHRCSSCGEIGSILCESCKDNIINEPYEGCLLCHVPCGARGICAGCRRRLPLEQAWCIGDRRDGLKLLGDSYKFHDRRAGALPLAELLDYVVSQLPSDAAIMPIPTLRSTVRARGFDHAGLVAARFAARRNLKTVQLLERESRETLHYLNRTARERLGPSLFSFVSPIEVPSHVVLVDDIVTTGTTLIAATRLLKAAGVVRVDAAILARQPFD